MKRTNAAELAGPYLEQLRPAPRRRWPLNEPTFRIGRDPKCNTTVSGLLISREHAKLSRISGNGGQVSWVLQDLSRNGTFVENGSRLDGVRTLGSGEDFELGEPGGVCFRLRADSSPSVAASHPPPREAGCKASRAGHQPSTSSRHPSADQNATPNSAPLRAPTDGASAHSASPATSQTDRRAGKAAPSAAVSPAVAVRGGVAEPQAARPRAAGSSFAGPSSSIAEAPYPASAVRSGAAELQAARPRAPEPSSAGPSSSAADAPRALAVSPAVAARGGAAEPQIVRPRAAGPSSAGPSSSAADAPCVPAVFPAATVRSGAAEPQVVRPRQPSSSAAETPHALAIANRLGAPAAEEPAAPSPPLGSENGDLPGESEDEPADEEADEEESDEENTQEDAFLLAFLTTEYPPDPPVTEGSATPPPLLPQLPPPAPLGPSHLSATPAVGSAAAPAATPRRAQIACLVLEDNAGKPVAPPSADASPGRGEGSKEPHDAASVAEGGGGAPGRADAPSAASTSVGLAAPETDSAAGPSMLAPATPATPLPRSYGFLNKPTLEAGQRAEAAAAADWLEGNNAKLSTLYGAPPFSLLDGRKGYWRKRRQWWEETYRINSERGRGDNLIGYKGLGGEASRGTSVFCPVVTELCYKWFCTVGGTVLDPFAGGSVRGCVAGRLGYRYVGIECSASQVTENRQQALEVEAIAAETQCRWVRPEWIHADARALADLAMPSAPRDADFIFSCPPYYNLEQYSTDVRDLSNAPSFDDFLQGYRAIIKASARRLAPKRFACFVVGEVRDADGFMRNFVGETVDAFQAAGCRLYNSAVMVFPLNSLPMRASRQFKASSKLGMCHQHVLVFYNGKHPNAELPKLDLSNADRPYEWRR